MDTKTGFIPELSIPHGTRDFQFYIKAFGAIEMWRIPNEDGSVHVAALSINDSEFRLHEERSEGRMPSSDHPPAKTITIALPVDDVHAVVDAAVEAGARILSPVKDYEYGYRQADIQDPFGHHWTIEKLLSRDALNDFLISAGDKPLSL
jgi:PhnB protein